MQLFAPISLLWALSSFVSSRSLQGATHFNERSLRTEHTAHSPTLIKRDDYSEAVAKGKQLWAALKQHCSQEVTEPSLQQLKELEWTILDANEDNTDPPADGVEGMFSKLGLSTGEQYYSRYAYSKFENIDGEDVRNEFANSYGSKDGVIIAEDNKRIKGSTIAWSTVTAFIWQDTCNIDKTDPKSLKYVFRDTIVNVNTKAFIDKVGMDKTFKPEEEGFFALLGSANGKGVAYLLLQHSSFLGKKTIKQVVTFKSADGSYEMYFEFEDWKPPQEETPQEEPPPGAKRWLGSNPNRRRIRAIGT
ncbi:MAG: hypothetical protein Q9209_007277 [Squamulea sp. 1 TL-2023]